MESEKEWVFVYGTLRPGASNAHRMEGAEWSARAEVEGRLHVVDTYREFIYPALIPGGACRVVGDLFRVPDEVMAALDEFEGDEYERVLLQLVSVQGMEKSPDRPSHAWVWVWKGGVEGMQQLPLGDWFDAFDSP